MNAIRVLFLTVISLSTFAQWEELDIESSGRYDDVFFIDESNGWAVGGPARTIYNTKDGGQTWQLKFTADAYMRSIEFATPNLGFAGSLLGHVYKTTDAGETWTDISYSIPFEIEYDGQTLTHVPGVCGISAPSATTIYLTGIWNNGPAYVIKSMDGGITWSTSDMTPWASQLVDALFIDENNGYVTGMANPRTEGGIILYTSDGGANWEVKHKTLKNLDYVWKIQTPDSVNYFGSIEAQPFNNDVRFVKSNDSGASWSTLPVQEGKWNYIQMIGFIDSMHGFTGGTANAFPRETVLFETIDGGANWKSIDPGNSSIFNRFFIAKGNNIFLTGKRIYKYDHDYNSTPLSVEKSILNDHEINISPNPTDGDVNVEIVIARQTRCSLLILDISGKIVSEMHHGLIEEGAFNFSISLTKSSSQFYYVSLMTNEGLAYKKIFKK